MSQHRVHFLYLVPSDREIFAITGINRCALHLRAWYRWQMGNAKTFALDDIPCLAFQTDKNADWFKTNRNGDDPRWWYWNNALDEAYRLAGAGLYQEFDTWVTYLDAPLAYGQGVGGAPGFCLLPEQDVRAVMGQDSHYTLCREIGGCGHELGHAFGMAHPDGDPQYNIAIMGTGYQFYPRAILTTAEKDQLTENPFFSVRPKLAYPAGLCPFNDNRPIRPPRPRPASHPRPVMR